ncbi:MAG: hypothetical protein ACLVJ6_01175 [Merdibacter sp.]
MEYALEDYLSGEDGWMQYQRAADGTELPGTRYVGAQAVNGNDVYLTLDANVVRAGNEPADDDERQQV